MSDSLRNRVREAIRQKNAGSFGTDADGATDAALEAAAGWFKQWSGLLRTGGYVQRHERLTTARLLTDPSFVLPDD